MFKRIYSVILLFSWELICLYFFVVTQHKSGVHLFSFVDVGWETIRFTGFNFWIFLFTLSTSLLGVMLFSLSIVGFGMTFIYLIDRENVTAGEGGKIGVTAFGIGQSIFSLLIFVPLLIAKQLPSSYTFSLFLVGLIFLFVYIFHRRHKFIEGITHTAVSLLSNSKALILLFCIIVFGLAILYSSSRLSYDAASQYFAQAKIIAVSEKLFLLSLKDNFVGSALYLEGIYAALIQLFGDQAARLYSWVNGLIILLSSMMIGEKVGLSRQARRLFLVFPLTTTAFVDLLGDGKIELAGTSVILIAVYWFLESLQTRSTFSFIMIGLLVGFAIVGRPYNAILIGVLFVSLFLLSFYTQDEKKAFLSVYADGFVRWAFPFLMLWGISYLIVNAAVSGNPLATLSVFNFNSDDWPFSPTGTQAIILILLYPFSITFTALLFDIPGAISPLFLAFLPLLFFKSTRRVRAFSKELIFISLASLVTLYFWVGFVGTIHILEARYVLFLWLLLFLLIAQLVEKATQQSFFSKIQIHLILILILSFMAFRITLIALSTYSPLDDNNAFHCRDLPQCAFFEPVNRLADSGDRVLVLAPYRYYLRPDLFACASNGDDYRALEKAITQGVDEFWREIKRQGYRFIIYDSFYNAYILRFRTLPDLSASPDGFPIFTIYDEIFKDYDLRKVRESIYRLDLAQFDQMPKRRCVLNNGKWELQAAENAK